MQNRNNPVNRNNPARRDHPVNRNNPSRQHNMSDTNMIKTRITDTVNKDSNTKISNITIPQEEVKEKKKKRGKKNSYNELNNTVAGIIKCVIYITIVVLISVAVAVAIILVANDRYAFVKSDEVIEITIPENATTDDIADILHDNGIVKYRSLFASYLKKHDDGKGFVAGTYSLSAMKSYEDLAYEFKEKTPVGVSWVTIPEGYTVDEIIDLMVSNGIGTREGYVDAINNYDFDYWFIDELGDDWADNGRIYRLEGYLFPDTYQFYNASSEVTVIKKMLARFNMVFSDEYKERVKELGYTVDQIITIASMIEKEANNAADFSNVASVFFNRLNNSEYFPNLESDATILYAMKHDNPDVEKVTSADLTYDSPYNSYTHSGLIPGPIANPSNSAILAAMNPASTSYYYFVSSPTKTYFSSTKAEHDYYISIIVAEQEQNN